MGWGGTAQQPCGRSRGESSSEGSEQPCTPHPGSPALGPGSDGVLWAAPSWGLKLGRPLTREAKEGEASRLWGQERGCGAEVGGQGSPPLFGALHWGQVTMISLAHPRQSVSALRDLAPRLPCPVKHSLTPIILGPCGHRPCTLRLDGESVLRQSWPLLRPLQPWGQGGHSARSPGPQLGFPRSAAVRQYLCRDAAVQGFSGPW